MNNTSVIEIFRGDDTDALGYQTIHGIITTDFDLTGCTVVFRYLDFTQSFTDVQSEVPFAITIPHDTTASFPPGFGFASIRVFDSSGKIRTFSNRIPVLVHTSTCCETEGGTFTIDFKMFEQLAPLKIYTVGGSYAEYTGYLQRIIDKATAGQYGLAMLYDGINSDDGASTGMAATPKAVKAALAAAIADATDKYYSKSDVYTKSEVYTKTETDEAIERVAAYYITKNAAGDAFATRAELLGASTYYSGGAVRTPTRNDYAVVLADETHDGAEWRYIYSGRQWEAQYPIETNDYEALSNKPAIDGVTLTKDSTAAGLGLAKTSDLSTVATSGSYNDLTNKPTIPAAVTVDDSLSSSSTNPVQNKIVTEALAEKRDLDDLAVYSQRMFSCVNTNGVTVAKVYFAPEAGSLPERVIVYDSDGTTALTDVTMAEIRAGATGWTEYVEISGVYWRYDISWNGVEVGYCAVSARNNGETFQLYQSVGPGIFNFDGFIASIGQTEYRVTKYNGTITDYGVIAGDDTLAKTSEIPPAQVQSNWNETDTTSKAYIQNKPTIPAEVTVDDTLTSSSANPVKSSGIWSALWGGVTSTFTSITAWVQDLLSGYLSLSGGISASSSGLPIGGFDSSGLSGLRLFQGESFDARDAVDYGVDTITVYSSGVRISDASISGIINTANGNSTAYAKSSDLRYSLGSSITASATLADRTANRVVAGASNTTQIALTFPTAVSGKVRDFTVLVTRETGDTGGIAFTTPTGATVYGDGFSTAIAEGKTVLYAITEVAENTWYTRAIEMEVAS